MTTTASVTGMTAMHVHVADLTARIVANQPAVTEWAQRYFGSWWQAEPAKPDVAAVVQVLAYVDAVRYHEIATTVDALPHDTTTYARKTLRLIQHGEALLAYGADDVAYNIRDGVIVIAGLDAGRVASASSRLAREALRGALARDGWVLLHASAAVHQGRAFIALGGKAAGKTSTVVQLAHANGWAVLANDRVFARPNGAGEIIVLPWPAAAAIGLGLLDAAGWYDRVAAARAELHSSTPAAVMQALARGHREPLHDSEREQKPQLFPDQLTSLLGLPLATSGHIAAVLFPTIAPGAIPTIKPGGRTLEMGDMFHGEIEDRYPNVFKLREPEPLSARDDLFRALNRLPRATLTLSHDIAANTAVLTTFARAAVTSSNSPWRNSPRSAGTAYGWHDEPGLAVGV